MPSVLLSPHLTIRLSLFLIRLYVNLVYYIKNFWSASATKINNKKAICKRKIFLRKHKQCTQKASIRTRVRFGDAAIWKAPWRKSPVSQEEWGAGRHRRHDSSPCRVLEAARTGVRWWSSTLHLWLLPKNYCTWKKNSRPNSFLNHHTLTQAWLNPDLSQNRPGKRSCEEL